MHKGERVLECRFAIYFCSWAVLRLKGAVIPLYANGVLLMLNYKFCYIATNAKLYFVNYTTGVISMTQLKMYFLFKRIFD